MDSTTRQKLIQVGFFKDRNFDRYCRSIRIFAQIKIL